MCVTVARQSETNGPGELTRPDRGLKPRRLLVALWRYLEDGVLPEGAELKAAG
ncbi:MAG: hypothetical protein ACHBMF_07975 [Chromatiales bacterium]